MQGLQVWDENGKSTLNTNDRTMKILGTLTCHTSYELEAPALHGGFSEGEIFWFYSSSASLGKMTVWQDIYTNNQGAAFKRINMKVSGNIEQFGGKIYSIMYGVY